MFEREFKKEKNLEAIKKQQEKKKGREKRKCKSKITVGEKEGLND